MEPRRGAAPSCDGGAPPPSEENPLGAWALRVRIQGRPHRPLAGRTLAVKDNIAVAGAPVRHGTVLLDGYVPDEDATVVERVLDAGAIATSRAADGWAACEWRTTRSLPSGSHSRTWPGQGHGCTSSSGQRRPQLGHHAMPVLELRRWPRSSGQTGHGSPHGGPRSPITIPPTGPSGPPSSHHANGRLRAAGHAGRPRLTPKEPGRQPARVAAGRRHQRPHRWGPLTLVPAGATHQPDARACRGRTLAA